MCKWAVKRKFRARGGLWLDCTRTCFLSGVSKKQLEAIIFGHYLLRTSSSIHACLVGGFLPPPSIYSYIALRKETHPSAVEIKPQNRVKSWHRWAMHSSCRKSTADLTPTKFRAGCVSKNRFPSLLSHAIGTIV